MELEMELWRKEEMQRAKSMDQVLKRRNITSK